MTRFFSGLLGLALALLVVGGASADTPKALRIGYQKNGPLLIVKQQGLLEKRLSGQGIVVEWHEFPAGPPIMEALHAGSVDFAATGDMPPIYAEAAGVKLAYVAYQPAPGGSLAVLVPKDSPIRTPAGLKGKRIAFVKGSSAHNLLVHVLDRAHLTPADIVPVYLAPGDAAGAFRQGSVAAWAIWDPFYALAELNFGARKLADGRGVSPSSGFFLADAGYVRRYPAVIEAAVGAIRDANAWAAGHQAEVAHIAALASGVPEPAQALTASRFVYDVHYMDGGAVTLQQGIADRFFALHLIPRAVDIRADVWKPAS
jgi:sulfonate transport system substrate-binding protein